MANDFDELRKTKTPSTRRVNTLKAPGQALEPAATEASPAGSMGSILHERVTGKAIDSGRSTLFIPLDLIRPDPENYADRKLTRDSLASMMASIRSSGLATPIEVRQDPDYSSSGTRFIIIAGERRWTAYRWLRDDARGQGGDGARRFDAIEAFVNTEDLDGFEVFARQHIENEEREGVPLLTRAKSYRNWIEKLTALNPGYTQQQLAEKLGRTEEEISKCLKLATGPEQLQRLFVRHNFPLEDSLQFVKIWEHIIGKDVEDPPKSKVEKIKRIAERRAAGELGREDLRRLATKAKSRSDVDPEEPGTRIAKPYFSLEENELQMKSAKLKFDRSETDETVQQFASELTKLVARFVKQYPGFTGAFSHALKGGGEGA